MSIKKSYLLAPGPTPVPESVLGILSQPMIHHRTPAFQDVVKDVRAGLKGLFQTQEEVLMLAGSGTAGMDAAVSNLFCKGDTVIVVNGGKFGERWTKIAKTYGLGVLEIRLVPGETLEIAELEKVVQNHPTARAILFQASETSTGVEMPVREICQIARKASMLSVCDGITACGVINLPMDEWGIDVLITGSQKALMLPPGLALIALSQKAWTYAETCDLPHFYFNLKKEKQALDKNQTAWTPAISLILGLRESLRLIREEGLTHVFKRHLLLAEATRNAALALNLELFAKKNPSSSVTAVRVPSTIEDGKAIPRIMRDRYGVIIAGGQDELEGKIFRLSHFGYCGPFDVVTGISALELTLKDFGHPFELGKGVGAVLKTLSKR